MEDFKKALLICLVVISLFVLFIPADFVNRGDFEFHYLKAKGAYGAEHTELDFDSYAPLGHFVASFFTYNIHSFYYVVLILNALITPMLLFRLCRKWVVVPLYFCASSYFYFMFMSLSQATAGILLLALLNLKNNYYRLLILPLAIVAHSQAFSLILVSFIFILLFEKFNLKNVFLGCSGVFGGNRPDEVLNTAIAGREHYGTTVITTGVILHFFFRLFPFPFFIIGVIQTIRNNRFELLFITAFAFMSALVSQRALFIIPLVLLPQVATFYNPKWTLKIKLIAYLIIISFGVFEFISWYNIGVGC